jgi:hypothetical protein
MCELGVGLDEHWVERGQQRPHVTSERPIMAAMASPRAPMVIKMISSCLSMVSSACSRTDHSPKIFSFDGKLGF